MLVTATCCWSHLKLLNGISHKVRKPIDGLGRLKQGIEPLFVDAASPGSDRDPRFGPHPEYTINGFEADQCK